MKYIKLLAVALGLAVVSSCSDDKDYNTVQGVTVEMGKTEVSVKEHYGRFYLPIDVKGDPNGVVKVKIKVEATGSSPAVPFEERNGVWSGNYIITSETLNIPADEKTANIEISIVDDKVMNDDRTFIVSIESAEGATIGSPSSTLVTLQDNDKVPYERIQGEWSLIFTDLNKSESSMNITLTGYDEGSIGYGHSLKMEGMVSQYAVNNTTTASLYFFDDEASDTRTVEIALPQTIGKFIENPALSIWLVYSEYGPNGNPLLYPDPNYISGQVSDDYDTITFEQNRGIVWWIDNDSFSSDDAGAIKVGFDIVMKRK